MEKVRSPFRTAESFLAEEIIDPREAGINFLKKIGKYDEPYFSFVCDGHYSQLGAKFMADYVSEYFLKN